MKELRRIYRRLKFLLTVNWLKTIYVNLRVFPLSIALKLPVYIFYKVELMGLKRGCIRLGDGVKPRQGMINIGTKQWPIMPHGGLYTLLRFEKNSHLILGDDIRIKTGCALCIYNNATMQIGNDFFMNSCSRIYAKKKVVIGNHCRIGWECQIYDSNFHYVYNDKKKTISAFSQPVIFGDNVWLTNRCTVTKNVTIPPFSMISSGSIVSKDLSHITTKGNLFSGRPAEFKTDGLYRILNEKAQSSLHVTFRKENTDKLYIEGGLDESWLSN